MDKGVGDHAIREERLPRAPCRRLFQSRTAVGPLPLSPLHLLTRSMQRFGLPLQARARPLARPRIASDPACSARRNRNCAVQPDDLRLRPALQTRRGPRCTSTPAVRAPPDIPQWRAGRPARLATRARRHCDGIRYVSHLYQQRGSLITSSQAWTPRSSSAKSACSRSRISDSKISVRTCPTRK
jgi:hypothetical protein